MRYALLFNDLRFLWCETAETPLPEGPRRNSILMAGGSAKEKSGFVAGFGGDSSGLSHGALACYGMPVQLTVATANIAISGSVP
jgi:hypothetical protein